MKDYTYPLGDTFPNIAGEVSYDSAVDTENMSAVLLVNGEETGPFTGEVIHAGGVSNNPNMSTFLWVYSVKATDTENEGKFSISMRITHYDTDGVTISGIETKPLGCVTVEDI